MNKTDFRETIREIQLNTKDDHAEVVRRLGFLESVVESFLPDSEPTEGVAGTVGHL